jgi:superoxide dismutase
MELRDMKILAGLIADEVEKRHNARMAPKWEHGTVVFVPGRPGLKQHELAMHRFMHKVVMVRDNLRILEQHINANKNLTEGEKIKLQSYITKVYGSLTSFNFMFEDEDDAFRGAAGPSA